MEMISYEVKGTYQEKFNWKPYCKIIQAPNEKQAKERIYNIIGSKHRLKRPYIRIESVSQYKGE